MKQATRILLVLTALMMLCATTLSGCAKADVLAAKVGDEVISVQTLTNMYQSNSSYASYYGSDLTTEEGVKAFQDMLLDSLIQNAAEVYQAKLANVTLTDEEKQTAKDAATAAYDEFYAQFTQAAEQSGTTDITATANKYLTETLIANGTTVSKVKEDFLKSEEDELLVAKHKEQLLADVAPTADELKEMYETELAAQEEAFAASPSAYFAYETYYGYGYSAMPLTIPEGFFYVRHILVEDEETAKKVLERIEAGDDFEALITEYYTDPGMTSTPEGYVIGEGANYVEPFLNAALALEKEGDVSGAVQSDYGYHIIKRLGNVPAGVIESAKAEYETYASDQFVNNYYSDLVEEWVSGDYVERYEDNYRSIGMDELAALLAAATPTPEATAEPEAAAEGSDAAATAEPADGEAATEPEASPAA